MGYSDNRIKITIDGRSMSATLAENNATRAFISKLSEGPVTLMMSNYGGFEKVGALPWSLPASDTRITTVPGDIMLYTGNNIVIFYGENTWSYTPLGKLETTDAVKIKDFVGNGEKSVTISLDISNDVSALRADAETKSKVYALDGTEVQTRPLQPGIYIIDKKKVIIR